MIYHLRALEAENIPILCESAAEFSRPAMVPSSRKDSSVFPGSLKRHFTPVPIPFPLLHIYSRYKSREIIELRDRACRDLDLNLIVHTNPRAIEERANPVRVGTIKCCARLRACALLGALADHHNDAAIGGARRDEERSRAKVRVFSFRDAFGQSNSGNQVPEPLSLFNGRIDIGESIGVFRSQIGLKLTSGNTSSRRGDDDGLRSTVIKVSPRTNPSRQTSATRPEPYAHAWMHLLHGSHPLQWRHRPWGRPGIGGGRPFRTREPYHR